VTLNVIEIVRITYCDAANPGCGCEDFAAIPVPGEKSNHRIDANSAIADHRERWDEARWDDQEFDKLIFSLKLPLPSNCQERMLLCGVSDAKKSVTDGRTK
jgi:hypothetical protein